MSFRLFVPASLSPANRRIKASNDLLGELPLAMLDGSATVRNALEREAQRNGSKLKLTNP